MQYLVGVFLIIISGISFGAAAIFARLAYEAGTSPITLLFLRFGIASSCMIIIMLVRGIPMPHGPIFWGLVLMGAVGYAGQSFCYFTALTLVPAGLVALLLYLYPAIVTVLAIVTLKEPITKWKTLALLFALTGTALTIGPPGGGNILGILLSLGAATIYSVYIIVGSKITKRGTSHSIFWGDYHFSSRCVWWHHRDQRGSISSHPYRLGVGQCGCGHLNGSGCRDLLGWP